MKTTSILSLIAFALLFITAAAVGLRRQQPKTAVARDALLPNSQSNQEATPPGSSTNGTNSSSALSSLPGDLLLLFQILDSPSNIERVNYIQNSSSFIFDFFNQSNVTSAGIDGFTIEANRYNFPAVFLNFISMNVGVIGPCGLHTPHLHLRGNEIALVIQGVFYSGFIAENGAPLIINLLQPGQMTVYGRGSIHWMANLQCAPALYLSALSDEIPGTSNVGQSFFGMPEDVTSATLGHLDPLAIDIIASYIPQNITLGLATCLETCGLV